MTAPDRRRLDPAFIAIVWHFNGGYEIRTGPDARLFIGDYEDAMRSATVHNAIHGHHDSVSDRRVNNRAEVTA